MAEFEVIEGPLPPDTRRRQSPTLRDASLRVAEYADTLAWWAHRQDEWARRDIEALVGRVNRGEVGWPASETFVFRPEPDEPDEVADGRRDLEPGVADALTRWEPGPVETPVMRPKPPRVQTYVVGTAEVLACDAGHLWSRPLVRGRKPFFCPQHR